MFLNVQLIFLKWYIILCWVTWCMMKLSCHPFKSDRSNLWCMQPYPNYPLTDLRTLHRWTSSKILVHQGCDQAALNQIEVWKSVFLLQYGVLRYLEQFQPPLKRPPINASWSDTKMLCIKASKLIKSWREPNMERLSGSRKCCSTEPAADLRY